MSGSETLRSTLVRGSRLNAWNTNPIFSRRMSASSSSESLETSLPSKKIFAARRRIERAQDVHERGFAGAGRPHDRHELAFFYGKGDAFQNGHRGLARPIGLFNVFAYDDIFFSFVRSLLCDYPPPPTRTAPPPPPPVNSRTASARAAKKLKRIRAAGRCRGLCGAR